MPLVVLIYLLGVVGYSPQYAGIYAIVTLIVVSMFRKETRLSWSRIVACLRGAIPAVAPITCLLLLAAIMITGLQVNGLGFRISSQLTSMAGGSIPLLLVVTGVGCLIMGMPLVVTASYIVLAALVGPALAMLGVPLICAHMFILYYAAMGPLTPPTCSAAFVAAGIAGENTSPYGIGFLGMRLAIVAFIVPFTFIYNPVLLMMGEPLEILLGFITAMLGLTGIGIGFQGWLVGRVNWLQRVLFLGAAFMLIWPGWQTDLIGVAVGAIAVGYHLLGIQQQRRRLAVTPGDNGRDS